MPLLCCSNVLQFLYSFTLVRTVFYRLCFETLVLHGIDAENKCNHILVNKFIVTVEFV